MANSESGFWKWISRASDLIQITTFFGLTSTFLVAVGISMAAYFTGFSIYLIAVLGPLSAIFSALFFLKWRLSKKTTNDNAKKFLSVKEAIAKFSDPALLKRRDSYQKKIDERANNMGSALAVAAISGQKPPNHIFEGEEAESHGLRSTEDEILEALRKELECGRLQARGFQGGAEPIDIKPESWIRLELNSVDGTASAPGVEFTNIQIFSRANQ